MKSLSRVVRVMRRNDRVDVHPADGIPRRLGRISGVTVSAVAMLMMAVVVMMGMVGHISLQALPIYPPGASCNYPHGV